MAASNRALPGVYVSETGGPPPPIQGISTGVPVFLGVASAGAVNQPVRVRSLRNFAEAFGPPESAPDLGPAVRLFFENGGWDSWVVRVEAADGPAPWLAALAKLDGAAGFDLMLLPGKSDPAVIGAALAAAQQHLALLLIDLPGDLTTAAQVQQMLRDGRLPRSSWAATYFPWIQVGGPPGRLLPPGGAVAGLFARTDLTRGVWRAPAGTGAELRGVTGLATNLFATDLDQLNGVGVNALRQLPAAGILVWGARTLEGGTDPEWRYVPVRRLELFLQQSLRRGLAWAVFEPNGAPLWARIQSAADAFLYSLWRLGAFPGSKPADACFAKCDASTTTAADVAAGVVNLLVGFAPLRPAEFVVLRLSLTVAPAGP